MPWHDAPSERAGSTACGARRAHSGNVGTHVMFPPIGQQHHEQQQQQQQQQQPRWRSKRKLKKRHVSRAEQGHRRAQWFKRRLYSEQGFAKAMASIRAQDETARSRATRQRDAAWIALEPTPSQLEVWRRQTRFDRHVASGAFHAEKQSSWAQGVKARAVEMSNQIDIIAEHARKRGIKDASALIYARKAKALAVAREQELNVTAAVTVVARYLRKRRARIKRRALQEKEMAVAAAVAKERADFIARRRRARGM